MHFQDEFTLLEYHTTNLSSNIKAKIKAKLDLQKDEFDIFSGKIKYSLELNSSDSTVIDIHVRSPFAANGIREHTNLAGAKDAFLTTNLLEQGFYQVMSPQTLFLRVGK